MIQNMRKDEDDRLDEEADIMRELEMEEDGVIAPTQTRVSHIQVEDSQVEMPLGPDRGSESEGEEEEEELGPDGKPRRVWKKKGLKRQTRRTNRELNVLISSETHTDAAQCDQILPSRNPFRRSNTTTKTQMPNQSQSPKRRQKRTRSLHYLMTRAILIMQAMLRIQRRSVRRQERNPLSRPRRKRAWSRK